MMIFRSASGPLADRRAAQHSLQNLASSTRRLILLDFHVHQSEWTAGEVANVVGVHGTVAHRHLERLAALGYLAVGQRQGRRGSPAPFGRHS
jgi:predicted ArsR family transcriptional regulator